MDRTDSGLYLTNADQGATTIKDDNIVLSHRHATKHTPTSSTVNSNSSQMENQRLASEKRFRRAGEPRRRSIASSSDNSTRSHGRPYGSKPSSRRTSCTLVDPSRPARHYRVKSSNTIPTVNSDIDDVLALHFRSCSLFRNPAYHADLPSTTSPTSDINAEPSVTVPHAESDDSCIVPTPKNPKEAESTITTIQKTDTTMHWTSPCTRRKEYEKIDRANSEVRGFCRRIVPRCVSGPPPPRFYEDDDRSDACSVRRYRMDLSDDEELDEKKTALLPHPTRKSEASRPRTGATSGGKMTRRWGCF